MLARLAREERVEAEPDGLVEGVGAAAGDDADRPDALRPGPLDERLAAGEGGDPRPQLGGRDAVAGERSPAADRRPAPRSEGLVIGAPEPLGQQGVVAVLGVGVERDVVGGEGDVVAEERPQALGLQRG